MPTTRKQKGVAVVEFALVLVPLVLIVFGITEFGRELYQYNSVVKAARDATRFLSTQAAGDSGQYDKASSLVLCGKQDCAATDQPVLQELADQLASGTASVKICDATVTAPTADCPLTYSGVPTGSGAVNLVTVSIDGFRFRSLIPFAVPDVPFTPISATMRQIL